MSIVKKVNKEESKLMELVMNKYIKISDFIMDNYIVKIHNEFTEVYALLARPDLNDSIFEYASYKIYNIMKKIRRLPDITNCIDVRFNHDINSSFKEYAETVIKFSRNQTEDNIIQRRIGLSVKKLNNIRRDVYCDMITSLDVIAREVCILLRNYGYKGAYYNELENIKDEEVDSQFKALKIFSYKEMCKHAQENDYYFNRQSGDHMIFKHKDSYRIVVIPAHELTKGLSIAIQKQIYARKVI